MIAVPETKAQEELSRYLAPSHLSLSQKCGTDADRYYGAMTAWLANRRDKALAEKCLALGTTYLDSLNLLVSLHDDPSSCGNSGLMSHHAIEYRSLLIPELRALERFLSEDEGFPATPRSENIPQILPGMTATR